MAYATPQSRIRQLYKTLRSLGPWKGWGSFTHPASCPFENTFKLPNFLPFPLSPPPFYPPPGTPSSTLAHSPFRVFIVTSFIQWIPHSPLHRRRLVFWFSPSPSPSYPRSNNNAPACPNFLFIYPIPQLRLPGDSQQFHRCRSAAINCPLPRKCCSVSPTSLIDRRLPLQSTTGQDRNASTLA